ncbi:MAG TPA: type II CRISPR-associated endonuclease Cas1 [Tissierella sp.]|uniref:type II CRISPR-associated endonuclease Cas1 n=1 Tax=Tissierella praeacuta TaxID=43131 RepID=UPI000EE8D0E3|nr:type II CRISPR-associated endonuclease Cas1 [Tissierella praeacuta]HAE91202.1 type II CRISPR-associated endonuclease Cas1 [Tissierella sp.]
MSWRNVMIDDGDHLKVYLDNIEIYKGENKYTLPLSDIGIIVLDGMMTNITTRLLSACSTYNVVIVICDKKHLPVGMYLPFNQHSRTVKIINKQIRWDIDKKGKLWQQIIKYKIDNQSKIMYHFINNKERYLQLQEYIKEVKIGDESNREGHAAKVYFNTLFGNDFYRDDDCIENAMMNYGYAIVRAYIARAIISYGYNPGLGIFHKNEYNAFCLADDILEIFRPVVDAYVMIYLLDNVDTEFLTQEIRSYLVSILSKRIFYGGQYQKISTIIDKFVLQCFDYLDPDEEKNVKPSNFEILTGEGIKK